MNSKDAVDCCKLSYRGVRHSSWCCSGDYFFGSCRFGLGTNSEQANGLESFHCDNCNVDLCIGCILASPANLVTSSFTERLCTDYSEYYASSVTWARLSEENASIFKNLIGNKVLGILNAGQLSKETKQIVLLPTEFTHDIYAVSHRWDENRFNSEVQMIVPIFFEQRIYCYYWEAKVEAECFSYLKQLGIENLSARIWFDQLCIPQDKGSREFRYAQVDLMGQLYKDATTVISGKNCATNTFETPDYFSRAWTQQEAAFGRVIFHPTILHSMNRAALIEVIIYSFQLCADRMTNVLDCVRHRSFGERWIKEEEENKLYYLRSNELSNYEESSELVKKIRNLWQIGFDFSDHDLENLFEALYDFRRTCYWKGQDLITPKVLSRAFTVECKIPKDQLYGLFGVVYSERTGRNLNYENPEQSYRDVLRVFNWPLMIINRYKDGDATGQDGCLTPLSWRNEESGPSHDYSYPKRKYAEATCIMKIEKDKFDEPNKYGKQCILHEDLYLWQFKREENPWIAFGTKLENTDDVGKAFFCVESCLSLLTEDFFWELFNILKTRLQFATPPIVTKDTYRFSERLIGKKDELIELAKKGESIDGKKWLL